MIAPRAVERGPGGTLETDGLRAASDRTLAGVLEGDKAAGLIRAYLGARRKQGRGRHVLVPVVVDRGTREAVDYGVPAEWAAGVAALVLAGRCGVEMVAFDQAGHLLAADDAGALAGVRAAGRRASLAVSTAAGEGDDLVGLAPWAAPHAAAFSESVTAGERSLRRRVRMRSSSSMSLLPRAGGAPDDAARDPADRFTSVWRRRDRDLMDGLVYGVTGDIGARSGMEDEHRIVPNLTRRLLRDGRDADEGDAADDDDDGAGAPPRHAFVGVYDGHGGRLAAEFLRDRLHVALAEHVCAAAAAVESGEGGTAIDYERAMRDAFDVAEAEFMREAEAAKFFGGAVAVACLVMGARLVVAHCGDCRAVLCRDGTAVELTEDHTPKRFSEEERVRAAGGKIEWGFLNGELGVTRAFGDVDPASHRKMAGLTATPDTRSETLRPKTDEFLILACDGLWDVMTGQQAVTFARQSLLNWNDVQKTSNDLVLEAKRRDSGDNISVAVVGFTRKDPEDGILKVVMPARTRRLLGTQRSPSPASPSPGGAAPAGRTFPRAGASSRARGPAASSAAAAPPAAPEPVAVAAGAAASSASSASSLAAATDTESDAPPRRRPRLNFDALKKLQEALRST